MKRFNVENKEKKVKGKGKGKGKGKKGKKGKKYVPKTSTETPTQDKEQVEVSSASSGSSRKSSSSNEDKVDQKIYMGTVISQAKFAEVQKFLQNAAYSMSHRQVTNKDIAGWGSFLRDIGRRKHMPF